ncbi:hypothetical protein PG995_007736 [Apiospora arundinis]
MTAQDPQSFTSKCALQSSKGSQTANNNLLPMPVTPTREREVTFQTMWPQWPASDEPWNPIGRENRMIEPETPPPAADLSGSDAMDMVATETNPLFPDPGTPESPMGDFAKIQTNSSCLQIPSDFLNSTVCRLLCEVTAQLATKHPLIDYCTARGADLVMVLNEGASGVAARHIARLAYL